MARQSWQGLLSISLRLGPKKALLVTTAAVCLLQETLAPVAFAGEGMFAERGCCSLILSTWQTRSDRRALCPFSYPFQLPIPARPLSLLLFLHCWEFLSCLGHGEVHGACIDVAVREGEVRVLRAGAAEPESRCTVVRADDSILLITSEQVSTYSSLSFSGKLL